MDMNGDFTFTGDLPGPDETVVKSGYMLAVFFVIDCSKTMEGIRIRSVNNALRSLKDELLQLKRDSGNDIRIAIMTFADSASWNLTMTQIDEVSYIEELILLPGQTNYGPAFRKLDKAMSTSDMLNVDGKKAPPVVIFMTDGEPDDQYEGDLDELLSNGWFTNSLRKAILLGDAIDKPKAKEAVSRFVASPSDIISSDDSTNIVNNVVFQTMKTIHGEKRTPVKNDPAPNPVPGPDPAPTPDPDPNLFGTPDPGPNLFGNPDPALDPNPGSEPDPNPFGNPNPVSGPNQGSDPGPNPFGSTDTGNFYRPAPGPDVLNDSGNGDTDSGGGSSDSGNSFFSPNQLGNNDNPFS